MIGINLIHYATHLFLKWTPNWEPKCNSKVYDVSLLKFFKINRENGTIYLFIHLVTETKSHADT